MCVSAYSYIASAERRFVTCCKRGHIVGIVWLGGTHKVCRTKASEEKWRVKTCCQVKAAHIFVTDLELSALLPAPFPFSKGNLFPVVGSIPCCKLPLALVDGCVKSSERLRKRLPLRKSQRS